MTSLPAVAVLTGVLTFLSLPGAAPDDEPAARPDRPHIAALPSSIVFGAAFSPDGGLLALGCYDKTILVYDARTGAARSTLLGHSERVWSVAYSPDGQTLASGSGEYSRPDEPGEVMLWDARTGKKQMSLLGHQGLVFAVAWSGDSKTLATASWDQTVRLWDPATGKEKAVLADHQGPVRAVAFAPDGKRLGSASFDGTVRLWDAATFQSQTVIQAHAAGAACLAFTPSGGRLVTSNRPTRPPQPEVKLWDLATGRELARFAVLASPILSLDLSPDGRTLAVGGGNFTESGEVKLVELCSGLERADLPGHREWVECVRFSPDGRLLVSGGGFNREAAGELHLRQLTDLVPGKPARGRLTDADLRALWNALAEPDAAKAYEAVLILSGSPASALPMLKERLRPAKADPQQLARLVADLDSGSFAARERAMEALSRLADGSRPALEKAAAGAPSVQARRRLEDLLRRIEMPISSGPLLQALRGVEVLGLLGTREARELLDELAKGVEGAQVTGAAREALARPSRRPGPQP